jgi:hypothetical protein
MAITYHAGRRIQGLSTDIADTATFEDDFSGADNWTDTGSGWGVNTTTDVIDFNADSPHNVTEGLYIDLGSALSSIFTIRFKLTIANFNIGSSSIENHLYFGVSDSTSHVRTQTQDIIGIHSTHWTGGNADWKTMTANGAALPGTRDYTFTHALQAETLYVQIKSLSSSQFQVDFYSDSGYSTLIESSGAQSHSATGLQYLKFQQRDNAPNGDNHTLNGTIDNIEVYDGATTNKPTNLQIGSRFEETDTRKMYSFESALEFDDDFSSNSGWTYVGTVSYNSSGYQNLTFTRNGNNNGCYYNLGTVSDTSWMLRAKLHLTTKSTSSQSSFIGLTSITGGSNSAQDAIGMFFITVNNTLFSVDSDGQTIAAGANSSNSFTTTNGNDYWIQITRLTATTMRVEIFDNANYTGTASITINDTIPSSIQSTNYLKLQNREELSNNGSSDNWTCDDVKFYNGVTSVSNTWKEIGA